MDINEKTKSKALIGLEKLEETFDYISETSKKEIAKYEEIKQDRIEKEIESLKNRIEDIILTYCEGHEITEAEENLIESKEANEELKKLFIQAIYSELVFKIINQLILNTPKEQIKEIAKDVISKNNINLSVRNVSDNIYDILDETFSKLKNNETMQFIWDLILENSIDSAGVIIKVDKIDKSLDDEDEINKFQA